MYDENSYRMYHTPSRYYGVQAVGIISRVENGCADTSENMQSIIHTRSIYYERYCSMLLAAVLSLLLVLFESIRCV